MEITKIQLGKWGENLAKEYLCAQGYLIKACNWRFGRAEADIIAFLPACQTLVFVEVKTRKNNHFGQPEEAVSLRKQNLLYDLANEYIYQTQHQTEFRFDIIAIVGTIGQTPQLRHFPDAFFPTW